MPPKRTATATKRKRQRQDSIQQQELKMKEKKAKTVTVTEKPPWQQHLRSCLLPLLHADIIPIVQAYASSIDFLFLRSIGHHGKGDGELNDPWGICPLDDELFVADNGNSRVQVFHQATSRFLARDCAFLASFELDAPLLTSFDLTGCRLSELVLRYPLLQSARLDCADLKSFHMKSLEGYHLLTNSGAAQGLSALQRGDFRSASLLTLLRERPFSFFGLEVLPPSALHDAEQLALHIHLPSHSHPPPSLLLQLRALTFFRVNLRVPHWDGARCTDTFEVGNGVSSLCQLSDGPIVSGLGDGKLALWDPVTCKRLATLPGHQHGVEGVIAMRDGRFSSRSAKEIKVWSRAQNVQQSFSCDATLTPTKTSQEFRCVIALRDGGLCSAGDDAEPVRIWREDSKSKQWQSGPSLPASSNNYSLVELLDGRICLNGEAGKLTVWDRKSNKTLTSAPLEAGYVRSLLQLSNGQLFQLSNGQLCSGHYRGNIHLWDISDTSRPPQHLAVLKGHTSTVRSMIELSTGQLCSASMDHTIKVWDVSSRACLVTLTGHTKIVWSVLQLADGRLWCGSRDETIKAWEPPVTISEYLPVSPSFSKRR